MSDTTLTSDDRPVPRGRGGLDAASWVPALVVLVVISLCVAGYALTRSTRAGAATTPAGTITVTGTGTIEGRPNTVQFSIGIHTVELTASAALDANNAQINRMIRVFSGYGVAKKDMQTTNVSIYEQTNNEGVFTGFAVDDDLQVTVSNMRVAGAAIDAGVHVAGGGIQFNGVSFSISNETTLLASARGRAMQSALSTARQLAEGGGESVGPIVKVTESQGNQGYFPYPEGALYAGPNVSASRLTLESGQQPVSVQVTVTYSLTS